MMLVAAATMAFAFTSCGDDGNGSEAAENTLVYNGKVYKMESTYKYEQSGRVYIDAAAEDQLDDGLAIFYIISDNPGNGTYDLSNGESVFFNVSSNVDYIASFDNHGPYSSGTVTIEKDDSAFRLRMSGTLENGPDVSFHIYVPASEWQQLEF